jgi:hypothetical protein
MSSPAEREARGEGDPVRERPRAQKNTLRTRPDDSFSALTRAELGSLPARCARRE